MARNSKSNDDTAKSSRRSRKEKLQPKVRQPREPREAEVITVRSIYPKNESQANYLEIIDDCDITFGLGSAGSGKTLLAVFKACEYLTTGKVDKIIISRPAVEACGEKLGSLPGDIIEKMLPFTRPIYDALYMCLPKTYVDNLIKKEVIEICPLSYMRGRTFNNSFIVLDEMQNSNPEQVKMALTRIGMNSKMVFCGDPNQSDLPKGSKSGIIDAVNRLSNLDEVGVITFAPKDIVRNNIIPKILSAYE